MMERHFCGNCGAQLRPDIRVCTACGQPIERLDRSASAVARTTVAPTQPRPQAPPLPVEGKQRPSLIAPDGAEFNLGERETYLGRGESNDIRLDHPGMPASSTMAGS